MVTALLEAHPGPALVLNRSRQVVAANAGAAAFAGTDPRELIGRRPGEVFDCANVRRGTGGCGTSPGCAFCALGRALSDAEQGRPFAPKVQSLMRRDGGDGAGEFEIRLAEISSGVDGPLTLVTFRDTGPERRRRVFERSLVDNLLDAASVVRSAASASGRVAAAGGEDRVTGLLAAASRTLADEALFHQYLLAAEAGDLQPVWEDVDLRALLVELGRALRHHPAGAGRRLLIRCPKGLQARTDRVLLQRAVRNLVRNALEASAPGDRVDVDATAGDGGAGVDLRVHNAQVMTPEVREQVFKRSFSTKAAEGRGIGLHAARLFVERYLGGTVGFESAAPGGTVFWIRIPLRPREPEAGAARPV
jgi:hypothetical protein